MNDEELLDRLGSLARECLSDYPNVAAMLLAAGASFKDGSDRQLRALVDEFARERLVINKSHTN